MRTCFPILRQRQTMRKEWANGDPAPGGDSQIQLELLPIGINVPCFFLIKEKGKWLNQDVCPRTLRIAGRS